MIWEGRRKDEEDGEDMKLKGKKMKALEEGGVDGNKRPVQLSRLFHVMGPLHFHVTDLLQISKGVVDILLEFPKYLTRPVFVQNNNDAAPAVCSSFRVGLLARLVFVLIKNRWARKYLIRDF